MSRVDAARLVLAIALLAGGAWAALRPGDLHAAPQSWEVAHEDGHALTEPVYVGVAAFQRDLAPWQPGYAEARAHLDQISRARRAALEDDRGALQSRTR